MAALLLAASTAIPLASDENVKHLLTPAGVQSALRGDMELIAQYATPEDEARLLAALIKQEGRLIQPVIHSVKADLTSTVITNQPCTAGCDYGVS